MHTYHLGQRMLGEAPLSPHGCQTFVKPQFGGHMLLHESQRTRQRIRACFMSPHMQVSEQHKSYLTGFS